MIINLQNSARLLLTGLSLVVLAACGDSTPAPSSPTGISGFVTAPDGSVSTDTLIWGCPFVGDCAEPLIAQTDASGRYTLTTVVAEPHALLAMRDANGDGEIGVGDHLGFYTLDGQYLSEATPPATDINISMQVIDETTTFPDVAP